MQLSKYVKKIQYNDDTVILSNYYNGGVYLIDANGLKEIEEGIENKHSETLKAEQFLVDKENIPVIRRDNDYVTIVIELSNQCNLKCRYCYEYDKNSRGRISEEVIVSTLKYIKNVMQQDTNNRIIGIRFIGGEPLLEKETLLRLYREIKQLGELYHHKTEFTIDTNGTISFSDLFNTMDNTAFFISLTNKEDHNKNRPAPNFDSFNTVVHNIKEIKEIKNDNFIGIRYNTNNENVIHFGEFVAFVKRELPVVGQIKPMYTDEYAYNSFSNKLSLKDYKIWNSTAAIDILGCHGFTTNLNIGGSLTLCDAYEKYSCKVYLDGKITLCDSLFHDTSTISIFDVCDNPEILEEHYSCYRNFDPMKDTECRECIDVARCMGKLACKTKAKACDFNHKYDEELLLKKYVDYCMAGKQDVFTKM